MKKQDRRVVRTRRQLRDALMQLILEKGYETITVQDITDRADLSRATFYLHFKDKEELLVNSLEEMFDALVTAQVETITPEKLMHGEMIKSALAFQHAAEYSLVYKSMLSERGVAYVMHRIQNYLAEVALRQMRALLPAGLQPPVPMEIIAHHLAGALFGLIIWWLENDMPHPPEYMAQMFHTLTLPVILAGFGLADKPDFSSLLPK